MLVRLVITLICTVASVSGVALPPIFFLPGYGSNKLFANISSAAALPASCDPSTPIGKPFSDIPEPCRFDLLSLSFSCSDSSCAYSSPEGVEIMAPPIGPFGDIAPSYRHIQHVFESWGYQSGKNLFAVPYDYRLMSSVELTRNGWIPHLQHRIESAHAANGKKILLIGHSNAGQTMYSFLKGVDPVWKAAHIEGMIGLSGNYLGQMNCIYPYTTPPTQRTDMENGWEGNYGSLPWGGYAAVKDIPVVVTFQSTDQEKNYTSAMDSLVDMFYSVGRDDWVERLRAAYGVVDGAENMMDRSAHPMVDTYCLYGSNLTTDYAFVYKEGIFGAANIGTLQMEGDGNQDLVDNTFCTVWGQDARPEAQKYHFESQAFPNVEHMQMVSDDNVMKKIHDIVNKYATAV